MLDSGCGNRAGPSIPRLGAAPYPKAKTGIAAWWKEDKAVWNRRSGHGPVQEIADLAVTLLLLGQVGSRPLHGR